MAAFAGATKPKIEMIASKSAATPRKRIMLTSLRRPPAKTLEVLEALLHQDGAQPATELETDLAQVALVLETKTFVQRD